MNEKMRMEYMCALSVFCVGVWVSSISVKMGSG